MTTTIEYVEDYEEPFNNGWWIVDTDETGKTDRTGPYFSRTEAVRWERETSNG